MHALLAHAYHLAQFTLHVLLHPLWRPPACALAVAGSARALGLTKSPRGAARAAGLAVLAGWLVLSPGLADWGRAPLARLPGLAVLWLAAGMLPRRVPALLAAEALLGAWWLCRAPTDIVPLLVCLPVALGLAGALRLTRDKPWPAGLAAALALAGALMLTGAAHHWARAALVPAAAALAGLDVSAAVVLAGAAAVVASDRGREVPVDLACLGGLVLMALWPGPKESGSFLKKRTKKLLSV